MLLVGHRRLIDQQDAAASDVASFRPDDVGTPPFGRAPVPRPGPAAAPSGLLQRPAPLGPPSRRFLRRPCGRRPAHRLLPHGLRNRSVYRVVPSFWAEMEEPFAEVQRMLLSQLMTCCVVLLQTWNRWSRSVRQFTSTWRCCTEFRHRKWIALFDSQNCNVRDDSVDRRSVSIFASSRSATT